jgi:hypothetical protein
MLQTPNHAGHGGGIGAREAHQVDLPLWAQIPEVHHHDLLTRVQADRAQQTVALATPASAHGSHDGGDTRHHHTATSAIHQQADGAKKSTSPSSTTQNAAVDPPASSPPTASMPLFLRGHDKCKAQKDGAPGPPWCTDPAAGWVQSTLHRTDGVFPHFQALKQPPKRAAPRLVEVPFIHTRPRQHTLLHLTPESGRPRIEYGKSTHVEVILMIEVRGHHVG